MNALKPDRPHTCDTQTCFRMIGDWLDFEWAEYLKLCREQKREPDLTRREFMAKFVSAA